MVLYISGLCALRHVCSIEFEEGARGYVEFTGPENCNPPIKIYMFYITPESTLESGVQNETTTELNQQL